MPHITVKCVHDSGLSIICHELRALVDSCINSIAAPPVGRVFFEDSDGSTCSFRRLILFRLQFCPSNLSRNTDMNA